MGGRSLRSNLPGPGRRGARREASGSQELRLSHEHSHAGKDRLAQCVRGGGRSLLRGGASEARKTGKIVLTYGDLDTKVKFCDCWRSSGVEQLPCKQWVGGSNPPASARHFKGLQPGEPAGRYPSGQRGQTVNLLAYAFGGSNPPLPTILAGGERRAERERGNSSAVERQPSKLGVAGSNPVSRSTWLRHLQDGRGT